MSTMTDRRIEHYLRDLDRALRPLPAARRREIVEEIRGHIDEARAEGMSGEETDVRALLERLGDPEDIAADAMERFNVRPAKPGALEVIALIMLPIGGLILPVIGWFVGVICLWLSTAWTVRDKLIGTLLVPGGLLLPGALLLMSTNAGQSCGSSFDASGRVLSTTCRGGTGVLVSVLLTVGFGVALILPVVVDVYLYRRLRRAAPRASAPTGA
jgi:uncharacterized membrane protein